MNMEDFYLELVNSIFADTQISELSVAIEEGNLDKAFELAHALKGVYANLALTPLHKLIDKMTELLRNRTQTDYSSLLNEINNQWEKLKSLAE